MVLSQRAHWANGARTPVARFLSREAAQPQDGNDVPRVATGEAVHQETPVAVAQHQRRPAVPLTASVSRDRTADEKSAAGPMAAESARNRFGGQRRSSCDRPSTNR